MFKKTITFTDFNGNQRTEDFYFHLSKPELAELELSHNGGVSTMIQRVVAEQDSKIIMSIFKDLICLAYGKKSDDGRTFEKSDAIVNSFLQSNAYEVLFMEIFTDADKAADFVNACMPADFQEELKKQEEEAKKKAAVESLPSIQAPV